MRRRVFIALIALRLTAATMQAQDAWKGVDRIIAVGDVHGDYEQLVAVLQSAGLINSAGAWIGGKTHLVQTGDVLDRGPESRKAMDLLIELQKQSRKSGGYVHALIGNHEAMNIYGDLRYVTPGEFAAFGGKEQHRAAFGPQGTYGNWIRSHNTVIKINDNLFLHGGLSAKYAGVPISQINQQVRDELEDFSKLQGGIVMDTEGPLWYRELATGDETTLAPLVDTILRKQEVRRIIIGHTFTDGAVTPRFSGKVILIDIGLARIYDNLGRMACLVIENGKPYALHRGTKLDLPSDSAGKDMLRYLKEASRLDPQPSSLHKRISMLEAKLGSPSN